MLGFLLPTYASVCLAEESDPWRDGRGGEEGEEEQGDVTWLILRLSGWARWLFTPDSLPLGTIL